SRASWARSDRGVVQVRQLVLVTGDLGVVGRLLARELGLGAERLGGGVAEQLAGRRQAGVHGLIAAARLGAGVLAVAVAVRRFRREPDHRLPELLVVRQPGAEEAVIDRDVSGRQDHAPGAAVD